MDTLTNAWKGWKVRLAKRSYHDYDGRAPEAKWWDNGYRYADLVEAFESKTENGYKIGWFDRYDKRETNFDERYYPNVILLNPISETEIEFSMLGSSFVLSKDDPYKAKRDWAGSDYDRTIDFVLRLIAPGGDLTVEPSWSDDDEC